MKKIILRSLTVILIVSLSFGAGYAYDYICTIVDRHNYPREYTEFVGKYAEIYGVPEQIIYATIKIESNFKTDALSSAGAIGLMQITPDTFDWLMMLTKEEYETGMLYDPETNIKYGVYFLSYLYNEFGLWQTAWAAYNAGLSRVRDWLLNEDYADENGILINIPFKETREYTIKTEKTTKIYERLYY